MSTVSGTLMTDRTTDDLANDTDRVYIAYTDLNRVGQACVPLAGLLHVDIRTKEQGMEDFRADAEVARLLGNIKALRAIHSTKTSIPVTPAKIIYSSIYQVDDTKQIFKDLEDMYNSMVNGQQRLSFRLGAKAIGSRG